MWAWLWSCMKHSFIEILALYEIRELIVVLQDSGFPGGLEVP